MALQGIIGEKVIIKGAKEGEYVNVDTSSFAKDGNVIGLYFSAHWCPPCRAFTPKLADWYKKLKEGEAVGDKFDIVFLSSDRDEKSYNEYFSEMPWHAVSYDNKGIKVSSSVMKVKEFTAYSFIRTLYHASLKCLEFLRWYCWRRILERPLQRMDALSL